MLALSRLARREAHSAEDPPRPLNALRVLSHNLWLHHVQAAPGKRERVEAFLRLVERLSPDVVCVQELFTVALGPVCGAKHALMVADGLRRQGYVYNSAAAAESLARCIPVTGALQSSGLATFSRVPLVESHFEPFAPRHEALNGKGFEHFRIRLGGNKSVRIFNTHMTSRGWAARQKQVAQIAAAVARTELNGPDEPLILVGDFNTDSNHRPQEFEVLQSSLHAQDLVAPICGPEGTFHTGKPNNVALWLQDVHPSISSPIWGAHKSGGKHEGSAIDHAFVRNVDLNKSRVDIVDERCVHTNSMPVSDHLGLLCEIFF